MQFSSFFVYQLDIIDVDGDSNLILGYPSLGYCMGGLDIGLIRSYALDNGQGLLVIHVVYVSYS